MASKFSTHYEATIHQLLERENPSIEDILNDESCVRCFRAGNNELVDFIMNNIKGVIYIALRKENSALSHKACSFFSTDNRSLINGLLQTDLLQSLANQIFSENPNILIMARFSSILVTCFSLFPDKTAEWCTFLDKFIPFCFLQPVLNLFSSIVSPKEDNGKLFKFLFSSGFIPLALSKINELTDIRNDEEESYTIGLYRLMSIFAQREEICQFFRLEQNLFILMKKFNRDRIHILNVQWPLYLILCDKSSIPLMSQLFSDAITYLRAPSPILYQFKASCLEFLTQVLTLDPKYSENYISYDIGSLVYELFKGYPNHSNAHFKILNLIQQCLVSSPQLNQQVTKRILPFAAKQIIERGNIVLSSFCWYMLHQIEAINNELSIAVQNLGDSVTIKMEQIDQMIAQDYGGEVPKMEISEINSDLPELTPDQLLSLFHDLTRR